MELQSLPTTANQPPASVDDDVTTENGTLRVCCDVTNDLQSTDSGYVPINNTDSSSSLLESADRDLESNFDRLSSGSASLNRDDAIVVHVSDFSVADRKAEPEVTEKLLAGTATDEANARDAVQALGKIKVQDRDNSPSPFGYKNWLLRLSHRRRLEILIATGLCVWIGFFIVLAIFMNGNSNEESSGSTSGKPPTKARIPIITAYPDIQSTRPPVLDINTAAYPPANETTIKKTTGAISNDDVIKATVTSAIPKIDDVTTTAITTEKAVISQKSQIDDVTISTLSTMNEKAVVTENPQIDDVTTSGSLITSKKNDASTTTVSKTDKIVASTMSGFLDDDAYLNLAKHRMTYENKDPRSLLEMLKGRKADYKVGVGRADITGPAGDVNMMGYADANQVAGGIHMRQYARSFIIVQGKTRVLFINADACMGSLLVKLEVLKVLKKMFGDLYTEDNLCLSATHTHSAPAGYLQDVLFQITSFGYVEETLKNMVDGIVESIRIAHDSIQPGHILINKGELLDANINRSPASYLNNPEHERKRYKYDVEKDMILLKFVDGAGKGLGIINWFPVHCTSMNNTNTLISGDNKGYAELVFEQEMDKGSLFGQSQFVAAFAQSHEGDVSPNTRGPHCLDTGLPCDNIHSTCNGNVQNCVASGPGKDMFESTKIIGDKQFQKALTLYETASKFLTGPLQAVNQFINMTNQIVPISPSQNVTTCKPAMGFSFAAGTTDGPGSFGFKQGDKSGNAFWKLVGRSIHPTSKQQKDCHYPKPILVDTGEMHSPYEWQPDVVDTQLFRIGQFVLSAVPGEFTTMSGRRLTDAVLEVFAAEYPDEKFECVVAGLSNTYSDYITTFEEYHVQRYEAASTIYGPYTLDAYIQQYKRLATFLTKSTPLPESAIPHDIKDDLWSLLPPVILDKVHFGYSDFGEVIIEVHSNYKAGQQVSVQFVAGNPRNSPAMNMTFLNVERRVNGSWETVLTDTSWDTRFKWARDSFMGSYRGVSEATITWDIASGTPSGQYRIVHHGHYKSFTGYVYPYQGKSKTFRVSGGSSAS